MQCMIEDLLNLQLADYKVSLFLPSSRGQLIFQSLPKSH